MELLLWATAAKYAAGALLIGAFILMVDWMAQHFGLSDKKMPTPAFLMVMALWPVAIGIMLAALVIEIRRRR